MQVAFLKGINLGRRRVRMEALRDAFANLGFPGATTYVASGNVLFDDPGGVDAADLEVRLAGGLAGIFGWPVATFVRTRVEVAELAAVATVAGRPVGSGPVAPGPLAPGPAASGPAAGPVAPGPTLQIGLLRHAPDEARCAALHALATDEDLLEVQGRTLGWLCSGSVARSKVTTLRVERAPGQEITFRNITTYRAIDELLR